MACEHCELTTRVQRPGQVVLYPTVSYLLDRLHDFLQTAGLPHQKRHHTLTCEVDSFESFLETLFKTCKLTQQERGHVRVAFVERDEVIDADLLAKTKTLARWALVSSDSQLTHVLQNDAIATYFHAIVDLETNEIHGHECLSRGVAKDGGIISPVSLLDDAREADLMFQLDRQMRITALKAAQQHGLECKIFINFIPTAVYNPEYCLQTTFKWANDLGLKPEQIVFEVVETDKIEDVNHLVSILNHYREKGFQVALDDVASGYSGLLQLMSIRPDIIKIDREIITDIHLNPAKQAVMDALLLVAERHGIRTLAEGVETAEELAYVRDKGISLAQGYFFGKPSPQPSDLAGIA